MKLVQSSIEEGLRASIKNILVHGSQGALELREKIDDLPLGNLLYELEVFWSQQTTVKSYHSFLVSALNGHKIIVVIDHPNISFGNLNAIYALGFIPAIAYGEQEAHDLANYFSYMGMLGGVLGHQDDAGLMDAIKIRTINISVQELPFVEVIVYGKKVFIDSDHAIPNQLEKPIDNKEDE